MPNITRKLKLKKPIFETEAADIRVINENMDLIDKFAEDMETKNDTKYDKSGGTISGNVVVQGNEIVNGSISCNSLILNGYTITIE